MNSSAFLSTTTFIYGLAATLYIGSWIFKKPFPGKLATWTALVGVAGNTTGIIMRWVESYRLGIGHAPLVIIYLVLERRYKNAIMGAFATPIAFLAMAYASLSPNVSDRIQPLLPALKSNWLIAHVISCFFGYAAFAIAFSLSLMYLIKQSDAEGKSKLLAHFPKSSVLDELNHQMVTFGFLFLSIGIITGAVWANSSWGTYWSWDPKETWSLITWFVYATLLHARMMRGWHGKRIAYISIVGFIAVIFTYFGVNYLPGLHSYGSG